MLYKIEYTIPHRDNKQEVLYMNTESKPMESMDIIDFLRGKKEYHQKQIKLINIMLKSARAEIGDIGIKEVIQERVPWSQLIDSVFENNNDLALKDVRQILADIGYPKAKEKRIKATIYQTLMRKVNKSKTLYKTDDGVYHNNIGQSDTEKKGIPDDDIPF